MFNAEKNRKGKPAAAQMQLCANAEADAFAAYAARVKAAANSARGLVPNARMAIAALEDELGLLADFRFVTEEVRIMIRRCLRLHLEVARIYRAAATTPLTSVSPSPEKGPARIYDRKPAHSRCR